MAKKKSTKKTSIKTPIVARLLPFPVYIIPIAIAVLALLSALAARAGREEHPSAPVIDEQLAPEEIDEGFVEKVLPEGFPNDFPIYSNARLEETWQASGKKDAYAVVWESEDTLEQITNFYIDALRGSGYEIVNQSDLSDRYVITFSKQGSDGFIGITKDEENVIISVTVGVDASQVNL